MNRAGARLRPLALAAWLVGLVACGDEPTKGETVTDPCALTGARVVSIGQTIDGALATSDCKREDDSYGDLYRLVLPTARTVRIEQSSTAFDTFLYLLDASGNEIGGDDDGGEGSNSRLESTLAAGTYYIVANSFEPGETGAYRLVVAEGTPPQAACLFANAAPISMGQSINGTLATSDCALEDESFADLYRFTLGATQTVQVDLASTAFDALLVLLDADGVVVQADDDGGGASDSRITRVLPPGTYYLAANSFAPASVGAYTLSLRLATGSAVLAPTTAAAAMWADASMPKRGTKGATPVRASAALRGRERSAKPAGAERR